MAVDHSFFSADPLELQFYIYIHNRECPLNTQLKIGGLEYMQRSADSGEENNELLKEIKWHSIVLGKYKASERNSK